MDGVGRGWVRFSLFLQLEFLREQMGKAFEFEQQLNELQDESVENYDSMKLQLEMDVQVAGKAPDHGITTGNHGMV